MKRKVCVFDDFAYACQYFNGSADVNNGYGCDHPKQEQTDPDNNGKEQGKCYCWGCPLGSEAENEDLDNPNIDWGGFCDDEEVEESEYILIDVELDATDDEKQALYNYECRLNRYNKDWDGGTWKHLHLRRT